MVTSKKATPSGATRPALPPLEAEALVHSCNELFDLRLLGDAIGRHHWPHRDRILTPEFLVMGLLRLVLGAIPSLLNLMDLMRSGGILKGQIEFTGAAFYKRLRVIPHEVYLCVLRAVSQELADRSKLERADIRALAPWAKGIYAIDDTTLDALARKTSSLAAFPKGAMETLGGRLGCALDVCTGRIAEALYDPDAKANEKTHFWPLLERLGRGNIVIIDLGYFSFPLFDGLTEAGTFFVTRMRKGTSFITHCRGVTTDTYRESLIYLGKHRADRASHPVRLIELCIGTQWHEYLTNVLEPARLPAANVWQLYKHRWGIEMAFASIKQGLGLAYLHPCHTNGVVSQVWCTLAVYQVMQDLRLRIAHSHGWESDDVSWYNLANRISWYLLAPHATKSLVQWLTDTDEVLALKKRGTRERVPKKLTGPLARALRLAAPDWNTPPPREARQGKPEPRQGLPTTTIARLPR